MDGGQSGTYLRLTRALSGQRVSITKTYRDENETKMNISAEIFIFVLFSSLYVLATFTRWPDNALVSLR